MLKERPASPEASESEDSDSSQAKNRGGNGAKDAFGPSQDFQGLDFTMCYIIMGFKILYVLEIHYYRGINISHLQVIL